jgi:hypothetical protein
MNDKTITWMKKHPRMVVLISVAANVVGATRVSAVRLFCLNSA